MPLNSGFEYRKRVGGEAENRRVIEYLVRYYPACTAEEWLARIEAKRVLLDGVPVHPDQRIQCGQILVWMRPPWIEPEVPRTFAILYRDNCLLAVAKPAGLPTLPSGGLFMENTLLSLVRQRFPGANPLHRLGRGTSGIVLFGLTQTATRTMFRDWREGNILKLYHALVVGHPGKDTFDVTVPIGKVPHRYLKFLYAASPDGKHAHSRVTVLERRAACSLVRVQIDTGRPHQIRIHMAASGFPLLGDPLYVQGGVPAPGSQALPSELGYHLHNTLLGIRHPAKGTWMEIACMPPPVLRLCGTAQK